MLKDKRLSQTLKLRRVLKDLTQEEVAERCKISVRQYQSLEAGRCLPSYLTALRLSIVLDFSLDAMKEGVDIGD